MTTPTYPTARTCPLDPETEKFCSDVVEFAYEKEASKLGISRENFRRVMQALHFAEDKSKMEFEKWQEERKQEILAQTNHRERVVQEREELAGKFDRLTDFLRSELHSTLPKDEKDRLRQQYLVMLQYKDILDDRIAAFKGS